jgi:hypothetical protein
VNVRSIRRGAIAAALVAGALSGCAKDDGDSGGWFSKPADVFGRNVGYTFSDLQETRQDRPITANDLVNANGACAAPVAPQSQSKLDSSNNAPVVAPDTSSLLGGGVGLGMSECDVVFRAGQPTSVEIGKNPNGDRTAVLTYRDGPRPGIYHFERGRLMAMDRVEVPAAAQPATKKPAKKPAKKNDQASAG